MELKRAKVHMLPTNGKDIALLSKRVKDSMLQSANGTEGVANCNTMWQPQHLYITNDEEVILGDGKVFLYEGKTYVSSTSNRFDDFDMVKAKNIIASTDKSLPFNLPQIPQSFIEEYCKAGGIEYIDVEYECLTSTSTIVLDFSKVTANQAIKSNGKCIESRLKLNPDNTIIIHPVEEMYTADSINTLRKLANAIIGPASEILPDTYDKELKAYWDWIEENL